MPLEISEIGIRMAVGEPATPTSSKAGDRSAPHRDGVALTQPQIDALVQACVQQVLDTLRLLGDR
jgi:hypothetical protein